MPACDERSGSNELAERLSESAEPVLSGRIHQIRIQGDCPAGKPRARDAGGVQDSGAAHLNSLKRTLESQISMSHLVPLLEFNHEQQRRSRIVRIRCEVSTRSVCAGKTPTLPCFAHCVPLRSVPTMTPWALANTSGCSRLLVMCNVQQMSPLVGRGRMNVCRANSIW